MRLRNSAEGYGAVAASLHWITALLVVLAWILGFFGDELPRGPARQTGLFIHISAGLLVLALLLTRIGWRLYDRPPAYETTSFGAWGNAVTKLAHYGLYVLLIAAPVAGIVAQFADGKPLPVFGLFDIPSPWAKDHDFAEAAEEVHELLAHALIILAVAHTAAALVHHWVLHDRTLIRMLPHARESE